MDRGTHPVDRTAYAIPIGDRGHTHHSSTQPSIKSIGVTPGYCASSARRGTRRSGAEGLRGAPHARAAAPAGVGRTLWGCCVLVKKAVCVRARAVGDRSLKIGLWETGGRPAGETGGRPRAARRRPPSPPRSAGGVVRRAGAIWLAPVVRGTYRSTRAVPSLYRPRGPAGTAPVGGRTPAAGRVVRWHRLLGLRRTRSGEVGARGRGGRGRGAARWRCHSFDARAERRLSASLTL